MKRAMCVWLTIIIVFKTDKKMENEMSSQEIIGLIQAQVAGIQAGDGDQALKDWLAQVFRAIQQNVQEKEMVIEEFERHFK